MRATRAYLAGFGTSGSLLAGAALMFVLASAFVAFHGWPQVGGQTAPASVSIPRTDVPSASRASRVLTGTVARNTPAAPATGVGRKAVGSATTAGSHATFRVHHATGQTTGTPVSRNPGTSHTPGSTTTGSNPGSNPGSTPHTCTSGCGGHGSTGGTVGTVKHTVTGAGSTANSTVGKTVTTVKKVVKKVTGGSGSAVNNTGSSVGNVVTTTKKVVNGITHGLP